jgi:hypothetical protein
LEVLALSSAILVPLSHPAPVAEFVPVFAVTDVPKDTAGSLDLTLPIRYDEGQSSYLVLALLCTLVPSHRCQKSSILGSARSVR